MIRINSHPEEMTGKIMKMRQEMVNPQGEIASEAVFTFGFMDMEKRKLIIPPKEWLKAIGRD